MTGDRSVEERIRHAFRAVADIPVSDSPQPAQARRRLSAREALAVAAVIALVAGAIGLLLAYGPQSKAAKHPTTPAASTLPTTTSTTPAPTTPPVKGTFELPYEPYGADGALGPGYRVTSTDSGTCEPDGVAGPGSYRCFGTPTQEHNASYVYDPCFPPSGGGAGVLVCPVDPARPSVVQFTATSLPQSGAGQAQPWAIELWNGQHCEFVDAAWGGGGPFSCQTTLANDGVTNPPTAPAAVSNCHVPVPGSPWWTAECQLASDASASYATYRVVLVWDQIASSSPSAVLPPATVGPLSAACVLPLTHGADGTVAPLVCPNGGVNVLAWVADAVSWDQAGTSPTWSMTLALGRSATGSQVLHALCADFSSMYQTLPITTSAETLASAYYGWHLSPDPATELMKGSASCSG